MAIRNEERYLAGALETLLAQDYRDFELIISDNASTDRTAEICMDYAGKDPRIRYTRTDANLGMTANQNRVFQLSRGEFFMWAAGHDRWDPQFISKSLAVMKQDPSVVLCYPEIILIDPRDNVVPDPHRFLMDTRGLGVSSRVNLMIWCLGNCAAIYGFHRSSALRQTRLFRNVICPDNVILFELSLIGSIAYLPQPLLFLRTVILHEPIHMGQSLERYRSMFYPDDRKRFRLWLTNWRFLYEHLVAVVRAPIRINRKPILLAAVLFGLLSRRGKHMIHDLIEACGFPRP